jgi:murein DD-endopeptidase MepM/ murein hydrolase activator NlpD
LLRGRCAALPGGRPPPLAWRRALPLLFVVLWAVACASSPGGEDRVHVVRPGENLYRISLHYGVAVESLIRANRIADVHALEVGQQLRIPGARRGPPESALAPRIASAPGGGGRQVAWRDTGLAFGWPLSGRVSSHFGSRGHSQHEGIDIPARAGSSVVAAEAGRVIHSGAELGDYGNVVIVKHAGRYATVYAHNRRNLVRKGEFVEKGQRIAQVGETGNASTPHLHFEIRRDRLAHDPLLYLP